MPFHEFDSFYRKKKKKSKDKDKEGKRMLDQISSGEVSGEQEGAEQRPRYIDRRTAAERAFEKQREKKVSLSFLKKSLWNNNMITLENFTQNPLCNQIVGENTNKNTFSNISDFKHGYIRRKQK